MCACVYTMSIVHVRVLDSRHIQLATLFGNQKQKRDFTYTSKQSFNVDSSFVL